MENHNDFNFWEEVNNDVIYDKLFPQSDEGRIILCLYNRIQNNQIPISFSQSDLEDAIKTVKTTQSRDTQGAIINKLHKYFILHNRYNNTYSLKEHANRFGELAHSTLLAHFEPAKIEKLCKNLRRDLEYNIEQNNFLYWKENILDKNKHEFNQQIEVLDEQINILINELRQKRKEKDVNFIDILQSIIDKLIAIEKEYEKLETAFTETEIIKNTLLDYLQEQVSEPILKEQVQNAIDFFLNTSSKLEGVNIRIDKLQPVIQQQIQAFGRSQFVYKTNRFIEYLLDNTELKQQKIEFPEHIQRISINTNHIIFNALRPWSDPPQITPRKSYKPTKSARKEAFLNEIGKIEIQKLVISLIKEFDEELKGKREVFVSTFYSKIVNEQMGKFDLIVLFNYYIIKKYDSDKSWQLEILPISIKFKTEKSIIELWEIRVFQRI